MKVLVTGSSGFIGREVVRALVSNGAEPVGMDIVPPREGDLPAGVPFVRSSVGNLHELMSVMFDHGVERILALGYIMAALDRPDYTDFIGAVQSNVLGITNCYEAAHLLGCDRVIFGSSVGVYAPQAEYGEKLITEDDRVAPRGTYGIMKLLCENLADRYRQAYGMEIITVRPSETLGAGNTMWPTKLINPAVLGGDKRR